MAWLTRAVNSGYGAILADSFLKQNQENWLLDENSLQELLEY